MPRTEYEIASDDHDMLNTLLLGDDILRDFPIRSPRMTAYLNKVQAILEKRAQRFQQQHDSHITDLRTTCESVTGA